MLISHIKKIMFVVAVLVLVLPGFNIIAQTPAEERQTLEQELKQLEEQIEKDSHPLGALVVKNRASRTAIIHLLHEEQVLVTRNHCRPF